MYRMIFYFLNVLGLLLFVDEYSSLIAGVGQNDLHIGLMIVVGANIGMFVQMLMREFGIRKAKLKAEKVL